MAKSAYHVYHMLIAFTLLACRQSSDIIPRNSSSEDRQQSAVWKEIQRKKNEEKKIKWANIVNGDGARLTVQGAEW